MNGNGKNGFWAKVGVGLVIPLTLAIIAYGTLRSDVSHNAELIATKADAAVMQTQYDAILREIQMLREELRER